MSRLLGMEDSWCWESLKMARWEDLGTGQFLAVIEQGNLEVGQPRLLATLDTSALQVMACHKGEGRGRGLPAGGGGVVLTVT